MEIKNSFADLIRNLREYTRIKDFSGRIQNLEYRAGKSGDLPKITSDLRKYIQKECGSNDSSIDALWMEVDFLRSHNEDLRKIFSRLARERILYVGQAYYNAFYLSRALRLKGWKADVLDWDLNVLNQIYYHGADYRFDGTDPDELRKNLKFFLSSIYEYDIFHFSNTRGICFGFLLQSHFKLRYGESSEIWLLKNLGKKIVYSNNGCLDGVSQTSFARWGPEPPCETCSWKNNSAVCSDEMNLSWGKFRNSVADYQCTLGGNRVDYNDDPRVREVPEFYCLNKDVWDPDIEIPKNFLVQAPPDSIKLYHAVGNSKDRTDRNGVNIKSTHVYLPLIKKLQGQGITLELISPIGVPNLDVRFLQVQADIFLDMLTFGWFGANAREGMMLGKPVICFIRPEWLESVRREVPDYADELPIISATPDNVEEVLLDLIKNPEKRDRIGKQSREFALKWHSEEAAGHKFDKIYRELLKESV